MSNRLSILGPLLLAVAAAGAQVASHAPTVFSQPSAPNKQNPSMVALHSAGKPVVRVNGSELTDTDLAREEYEIFPYARQHGGLPRDLAPQIRDGAMKMLIFEELVYQEALRQNIMVSPAKLRIAEADFRKQFSTPDEFSTLFQTEFHGSHKLLLEKIKRSLLIETFMKIEVENKSAVSLSEAKAYYDKNPARFQRPESYTFQTISILPPPNASAAQLKEGLARAEQALRQARLTKTAEEFGLLAEKTSDDDYRVVMGQHKPVTVDQLAPQVLKTLQAMKPGDVSNLLQIEQAYTIVRLNAHEQAGKVRFEEVREQLRNELQQNKRNQLRAALDKKLRESAKIEEL